MLLSEECEQYKTFKTRKKNIYVFIMLNIFIIGGVALETNTEVILRILCYILIYVILNSNATSKTIILFQNDDIV